MPPAQQTVRDDLSPGLRRSAQAPGVLLVFQRTRPVLHALRVPLDGLELGREALAALGFEDDRISRRHLRLSLSGDRLRVEDAGSTNGVFLDGRRLEAPLEVPFTATCVVRLGHTLLLPTPDVTPFAALNETLLLGGVPAGPALRRVQQQVTVFAQHETTLCLVGERGVVAAELARRFFTGTSVEVSCAASPARVTEQLFDDGGRTLRAAALFLDDLEALSAPLQGALLRALEASAGSARVVSCVRAPLRELVEAGRFSLELAERLGRPSVRVPPLRERREELPWRLAHTFSALGVEPTVSLVEQCLLRPWPGNEGELEREVRAAASLALADGATQVDGVHLDERAGRPLEAPRAARVAPDDPRVQAAADRLGLARKTALKLLAPDELARWAGPEAPGAPTPQAALAQALLSLLERHDFEQAAVAQALDVSRTTLLKLVEQLALPRASMLADADVMAALAANEQDVVRAARALRVSAQALRQRLARPAKR